MVSLVPIRNRPQVPASQAAADTSKGEIRSDSVDGFIPSGPSQFPDGHAQARLPAHQVWGLATLGQMTQAALKAPAVGAVLLALAFGGTAHANPVTTGAAFPVDHAVHVMDVSDAVTDLHERTADRVRPHALEAMIKASQTRMKRGSRGPDVRVLQDTLSYMGYPLGQTDGAYGGLTTNAVRAFQIVNDLRPTGEVGKSTWDALMSPDSVMLPSDGQYQNLRVYRPNSPGAFGLFLGAAQRLGVPPEWALSRSLHSLLRAESNGEVGRPNYTYRKRANSQEGWQEIHTELKAGRIKAKSSATGLGQLILANVHAHYPSGAAGIDNPMEEAIGMLSYIKSRHRDPDRAWGRYNSVHEGY